MAKEIQFSHKDFNFSAGIVKVDRKKIYGYSRVEVKDADDQLCHLASLSDDGSHILPLGSTGITKFDSENNYIDNKSLKAVDLEGNPAETVLSVFEQDVELQKADSLTDYLDLNVKSIYQLNIDDEDTKNELIKKLNEDLYQFIFNYRTGYEGNEAFLITDKTEIFAIVGTKCEFEYLSLEQINTETDTEDEEEDDFDFGML